MNSGRLRKTTPVVGFESHRKERHPLWRQVTPLLWTIFTVLIILWLLGWGFHIAGSLIHLVLAAAIIVLILVFVTGQRASS